MRESGHGWRGTRVPNRSVTNRVAVAFLLGVHLCCLVGASESAVAADNEELRAQEEEILKRIRGTECVLQASRMGYLQSAVGL